MTCGCWDYRFSSFSSSSSSSSPSPSPSSPSPRRRRPLRLGWTRVAATVIQALLFRAIYAQQREAPAREGYDYDVVVAVRRPLGAALGRELEVQHFQRDKEGEPSFLQSTGVQVGDRLLRINEESVSGLQPKEVRDLLQRAGLPFTLTFRPHDSQARDVSHIYSPQRRREEDDVKADGHVDVLDGPLSLFSVKAVRAKFGGVAQCGRKQLLYADPQDGCSPIRNKVEGKYVLIKRGNCSFTAKAMNAGDGGAAGVLVINSEPGTFRMPHDERDGEEDDIPFAVVMLSKSSGEQVDKALRAYTTSLHARLVVTEECIRGEADWHKVHDVAWKDSPHLHPSSSSKAPPPRAVVNAKGIAQEKGKQTGEAEPEPGRPGKQVPSSPPKGAAGVKWASREERQKRAVQANAERVAQGMRSGEIRVLSRNTSYEGRQATDVAGMMARAPGVLVARAEFMGPSYGGAIPLGPRGIVYTGIDPNNTFKLYPPPQPGDIAVMSFKEGDDLIRLLENAQSSRVSMVALVGNRQGKEFSGQAMQVADFDEETQDYLKTQLELAVVELGRMEGDHVISHLINPDSQSVAEVVNRPEVAELWRILGDLQDPSKWPRTVAQQQRLFLHLKQKHDPANEGGSVERWRYLVEAFENLGLDYSDLLQEL